MKRSDYNPLEKMDNADKIKSDNTSKIPNQDQSKQPSRIRTSTIAKPIKTFDDIKYLSFSLILNKNFNYNDSLESNWNFMRKNLIDIFCSNSNMQVKSLYSISMDEEDLQKNYKIDQGRNRLEEIEGKGVFNILSSSEFVAKVEVLKREMLQKWEIEDKVGALKIIIHCTKMLNDVFTAKFYTHKFLVLSDILDNFAKLVYDRIYKLSFGFDRGTDFSDINSAKINNTAKDICFNWILKCSCIRELLPRIYIDITFLRIFRYIYSEKDIEQKIITIAKMIRGISHPLISFYVSMYFARISLNLYPKFKSFLFILLDNISKFTINEDLIKKLEYSDLKVDELKKVLEPCVEWIINCLSKSMTSNQFNNLMKVFDQSKNFFIIKNLIIHSPVKFLFNPDYLEYIYACADLYDQEDSIYLYTIICQRIINSNNPIEGRYINLMWEKIKKCKSKGIFIDCCILLGEIVIKFNSEEIQDKFFEEVFDIFKATIAGSVLEDPNYYHKFEVFLYSILTKINNYSSILNVDNFLYLLENFNDDIKLNICHTIMTQIIDSNAKLNDPFLAFSLLKIGKYLHDSIQITQTDISVNVIRKKEITEILVNFIRKVDFGIDYENHLNFLTDARGAYTDIDEIIELLITEAQRICILTNKIMKGKHNKKTLRFCKVCIAYCQITIPSIQNNYTQLKLLISTANLALTNNLISECDSLLKNILTIISKILNEDIINRKIEKSEIDFIINYFKNFISFLIVVPSNPESPFQLMNAIMNIFNLEGDKSKLTNNLYSTKIKIKLSVYLNLVKYLSTQMQMKLPYHIINVDSNDEIFPGDEVFKSEAQNQLESIIDEILNDISEFDSKLSSSDYDDYDYLSFFCISCTEIFIKTFEETKMLKIVSNKMLELAKKYIEHLKKNSSMKSKVEYYLNYINRIIT